MTTWVKVTPDSATWQGAGTLLWLLTESGENMLNEDGDLWLLEESKIDTWLKDGGNLSAWNKSANSSPTWSKKPNTNPNWIVN